MAAVTTSPPPTSTSPGSNPRDAPSLPRVSGDRLARKPLGVPSPMPTTLPPPMPPSMGGSGAPRLRDAPVSPVTVNFQHDNWAQPSNADIEFTSQPHAAAATASTGHFDLVDRSRVPRGPASNLRSPFRSPVSSPLRSPVDSPGESPSDSPRAYQHAHVAAAAVAPQLAPLDARGDRPDTAIHADLADGFDNGELDLSFSSTPTARAERYEPSAMSPTERVRNQDVYRNSRESDDTSSSNPQPASVESSAPTSASSLSGIIENVDNRVPADSPESSIIEGSQPGNQPVPQFQYHHQEDHPPRTSSVPHEDARTASNPDLLEGAANIRRHLTPTSNYFRRSSLPRPQSSYSVSSDMGARGRSPGLMPGGSHMRAPSVQSRKSPDPRQSTYGELLNVPYPQQAPAPLAMDNSNLRTVVGNNASLLSTQKTLEMYRQNVKKTTDFSIQYSFAVFLISSAQEQGLDLSDPKGRKTSPQPLRDLDSPIVEATVASPNELVREARQILQRLSNGGYPFAQYYLADGYASGLFSKGKEDYNSAFPLFVLAAKHGHAESAYRTALCYEFGWGCRKDPTKALQFLRTAASKRHPGAMTRLGKACLSGDLGEKRYREGIKWLKLATEAADTQYNAAPYQLGCLYETGYGDDIFQDLNYAAELFTQAADLGHPEANFRMGDAYEHGRLNCPRDPALSVHFYTGAAERGHAAAMMGLCAWYMVGAAPILEKDEEEAYEWARRSAELGFVKAQYALGYFTEMGIGCRRDILEANVWYVKAADAGDERATQRLAIIQAAVTGEGTPMDVAAPRGKKGARDDKDCVVM